MIKFLKRVLFFQNALSFLYSLLPPFFEHNIGKYVAIKKAFYLTALDKLDGDYLEFGVFTGSSFVMAMRAHRSTNSIGNVKTNFFGFDSFEGFGNISKEDSHPFYLSDTFRVDAKKIKKNIFKKSKNLNVKIIEGYYEDSIKNKTANEFKINNARIIFIDCDLMEPAKIVLEFVKPVLRLGTILIMDDYFSYKGSNRLGLKGAFSSFCNKYPQYIWRTCYYYGYGGCVKILSDIKK